MVDAFAFKYDDEEVLRKSSSGGAFSALSDYFLENNGILYGAAYNFDTNKVMHVRASNLLERDNLRGSKYLQSKIGDTFSAVCKDLKEGQQVLFSGTICQVAGLKNFLNVKNVSMNKLFTCDVICHGVASPLVWKQYIEYKSPQKLKALNFRNKDLGWTNSKAIAQNNESLIDLSEYMKLYYGHTIMRPSCHACKFASTIRCSEITIGDFWGIEKLNVDFDYNNGASFIMANNERGKRLLETIFASNPSILFKKVNINDVRQPNFYAPTKASVIRDRFWKDYRKKGISFIIKKYASDNFYKKIIFLQKIIDSIFS